MQDGLVAGRVKLEDHAKTAATTVGCSIEVSRIVHKKRGERLLPIIGRACECMEDGEVTAGIDLENDAAAIGGIACGVPAIARGSV